MASNEVLQAFVQAATLGSFSAAARKLGKSQSTISAAVAGLEIDLGFELFDRSTRKPGLTAAGHVMLRKAEDILAANNRLEMAASQLAQGLEAKLTVVISDTYQSDRFEAALSGFAARYPDLELECLIAECADLVELVQQGRAQLAFAERQDSYPPDLSSATVDERTEFAVFVHPEHPLASLAKIDQIVNPYESRAQGRIWSASSYLMLLEMAQRGFGWAPLPRWLVERFAGSLVQLQVRGWPRPVAVDALWSRLHPPGPAGSWLLTKMLE